MSLASKVAVNVSALVAGRVLNAVTGVIGVAIAARYLHPGPYGALVAGIAFAAFLQAITDLGTTTIGAREIAKRPGEQQRLLGAVLSISAVLAAITLIVAVGLVNVIYGGPGRELERHAALLIIAPTVLQPLAATAGTYFIAEQKNYMSMAASVLGSLALFATILLAVHFDWGFNGIAAAYMANGMVFALAITFFGIRSGVRLRPSFDWPLCRQLFAWAVPLGVALTVSALYLRLDVILLSVLAPAAEVGPYGLAFKVVDVLLILPSFMMLTLLPELARLSEERHRLSEIAQKAFSVMQTVVMPITVLLAIFAPEVVRILGGPAYAHAASLLRILMVGVVFSYFGSVCDQGLVALNKQRSVLMITLVGLTVNAVLNVAFIPLWGGIGSAIAYAITEAAFLALAFNRFARVARPPRPVHVPGFVGATGAMAVAGLIKIVPGVDALPALVVLAGGGALGLGLYAVTLYTLRAVPDVVQDSLVVPVQGRLRARAAR